MRVSILFRIDKNGIIVVKLWYHIYNFNLSGNLRAAFNESSLAFNLFLRSFSISICE